MALNIEFKHQSKRVKVTPAMTMFQVVESSRELFGLDASAPCELLHRGRTVDLSIPFRLTGISNNATLELREASGAGATAAVQQVRVAVQLLDGKRVQEAVGSAVTLEHLLTTFHQLPAAEGHEFSLTYMQREIPFDSFSTTTLQDLGIVSGSAMFRMVRSTGGARPDPSSAPAPAQAVSRREAPTTVAPPVARTPAREWTEEEEKHSAPPAPVAAATPAGVPSQTPLPLPTPVAPYDEDVEMTETTAPPLTSYAALQLLRDSCFDTVSRPAIITLMKIVTNILSYPDNDKMRSVRVSNAAFDRTVGRHKGGIEFLQAIGFVFDPETQALTLTSAETAKAALEKGLQELNAEADDLRISPSERPQVVVPVEPDADFDAFKPIITRLQAQPRGPSATEVLVDNLKTKQEELLQRIEKPQRNTTVVFPGQQTSAVSNIGQADTEDVGPSDSSLVIASMKARRAEMEKAQNFRTQAMRELDELKRKKVFQQALIRVQFPDRVVLHAAFHPMETIADVMAHVRESLDPRVGDSVSFYLYVSPPLQKLAPEKTLSDLGLVPAAHTYLSWIDGPPFPSTELDLKGWYLRQELLTPDAPDAKSEGAIAYPNSIPLDEAAAAKAAKEARSAAADAAQKRAATGESKGKSSKKPSWLKL